MRLKDPYPSCPVCKAEDVRKRIAKTDFILKGTGWYKDHYGLKEAKKGE